jgi:uncharacterized membrane protein YkoI
VALDDRSDNEGKPMKDKMKGMIVAVAALAALAAGGAAIASAGGNDAPSEQPTHEQPATETENESADDESGQDVAEGPDTPISGSALDRASAAALDATGGGKLTETEVGDEESEYEVEVTLDDGSQVDVQLDSGFNVVGQESDGAE